MRQKAKFGAVMASVGITPSLDGSAAPVARVERELLGVRDRGLAVPGYVTRAFREAVELACAR